MNTVEQSIEVNVPIDVAYNQWTQFEEFPRFMEGVEAVSQIDDTHLHWVADVSGRRKEWDAEITDQVPDRRIAWQSTSGARNDGVVTFDTTDDGKTRVSLQLLVEPDGVVEQVGSAVGILGRDIQGDLERFKDFVEARGRETGGWRGEVRGGSEVRTGDR